MKSLVGVLCLALFAATAVVAADDDQPKKVCFQGNGQCAELKEAAKGYFRSISGRALPLAPPPLALARPGSPGAGAQIRAGLVKFLDKFQELFDQASKYECKVNVCGCVNGTLQCTPVADKVKEAATKAQAPECVERSEKAKAFFEKFQQALAGKDRAAISEQIQQLRDHVSKEVDEQDKAGIDCFRETLLGLRRELKDKLKNYDIQENCNFCKVDA